MDGVNHDHELLLKHYYILIRKLKRWTVNCFEEVLGRMDYPQNTSIVIVNIYIH